MPAIPDIAPARTDPRAPGWITGAGGWDTHAHVFGPADRFPYQPARSYTPPEQVVGDYIRMLDALGLRYGVLVQPSVYGHDNRAMLDAMRQVPGRLLTVVELDLLAQDDAALDRMSLAGVCGLRMRWPPSPGSDSRLDGVMSRLRELGWHLDVHCGCVADAIDIVRRAIPLGGRLMIEAMGSPVAGESVHSPAFKDFLGLLRDEAAFVKLSHAYQVDRSGPPYPGTLPFAQAIVAAAPGQVVWGSDWPHPMRGGTIPDDGELLGLLPAWAGDSVELARRILTQTPARFYGLPPAPPP